MYFSYLYRSRLADLKIVLFDLTRLDLTRNVSFVDFLTQQLSQLGLDSISSNRNHQHVPKDEEKHILDHLPECNQNSINKDFRSKQESSVHTEVENIQQRVLESEISDTIIVFNKLDLVNNSEILKIHNWIAGGKLSIDDRTQEPESSENYDTFINDMTCHRENNSGTMEKSDELSYKLDSVSKSGHAISGKGIEKIQGNVRFDRGTNTISLPDKSVELFNFGDEIGSSLRNIQNNVKDFSEKKKSNLTPVVCCISCVTGAGMDRFLEVLKGKVSAL